MIFLLLQHAVSDTAAVDPSCASSTTFVLAGGEVSEDCVRVAFEVCSTILSSLQKDAVHSLMPVVEDFPAKAAEVWGRSPCP